MERPWGPFLASPRRSTGSLRIDPMAKVLVIGGSVAGLATALAFARDSHQVTLVERELQAETSLDAAFESMTGPGSHVPQRAHSHAFLARARNLLASRMPDVLSALLDVGTREIVFADHLPDTLSDRSRREGDEDLVALACRRSTFEWVLHQVARRQPGIEIVQGEVAGLVAEPVGGSSPPVVRGAELTGCHGDDPRGADSTNPRPAGQSHHSTGQPAGQVTADLVVDASGRWSRLASWLEAVGSTRPEEEVHDSGLLYLSRFYRLRPGVEPPPAGGPIGDDLVYCKYGVFQGDNDAISVTFAIPSDDRELRALLRAEAFDTAASAMPATAPWVEADVATPVSKVAVMGKLTNVRRRMVVGGMPPALGVLPVGDAATHTNPLYGRGCTLALVGAIGLADLYRDHGADGLALALAYEDLLERESDPWFRNAIWQDSQSRAALASYRGEEIPPEDVPLVQFAELLRDGILPAARTDPLVNRAFLRVLNLLDTPEALFGDPRLGEAVLTSWEGRSSRPAAPPMGPDRADLLDMIEQTCST